MVTVDVMGESGLGLVRCCLLAVGEPLMLGQGRLQQREAKAPTLATLMISSTVKLHLFTSKPQF